MLKKTDKGFVAFGDHEKTYEDRETHLFLIERCPTPGCKCNQVRPVYKNGTITGFTCTNGCSYRAKTNTFSDRIDYFELVNFNPYKVDPNSGGFRVNPDGSRYMSWI